MFGVRTKDRVVVITVVSVMLIRGLTKAIKSFVLWPKVCSKYLKTTSIFLAVAGLENLLIVSEIEEPEAMVLKIFTRTPGLWYMFPS